LRRAGDVDPLAAGEREARAGAMALAELEVLARSASGRCAALRVTVTITENQLPTWCKSLACTSRRGPTNPGLAIARAGNERAAGEELLRPA
jgi:hypothetical protein